MKKLLALLLVACMMLSLCACGKSKEATTADELILAIGEVTLDAESRVTAAQVFYDTLTAEQKTEVENLALLENATQTLNRLKTDALFSNIDALLSNNEYKDALTLLRTLDQTEEVKEYIRKASFGVLAEFAFQNGTKGSTYGTSDGDGYYTKLNGTEMVLSTVPSTTGFESVSFGLMPSDPKGILSAENYLFTLYEEKNHFDYFYMFMFGATSYCWDGTSSCGDYTRETPIDFEINVLPDTADWQISSTPEETKFSTRDEFNNYLDEVSLLLRKLDLGVSIEDLGFYAYK